METEDEMDGIESAMDDLTKSPGQVLDEFSVVDPFLDETSDQEQEEISNDAVEITDDALNIPNENEFFTISEDGDTVNKCEKSMNAEMCKSTIEDEETLKEIYNAAFVDNITRNEITDTSDVVSVPSDGLDGVNGKISGTTALLKDNEEINRTTDSLDDKEQINRTTVSAEIKTPVNGTTSPVLNLISAIKEEGIDSRLHKQVSSFQESFERCIRSCSVDIANLNTTIPKSTPLPLKEPPVAPKPAQSRGKEIKASHPKAPKPCTRQLRERSGESGNEATKEKVESNAETWRIDYIRVETEEKKPKKKKSKSGKKKEKVKATEVPLTVKDEYPRKLTIALAPSKPSIADTKKEDVKKDLTVDWEKIFSFTPSTDHAAYTNLLLQTSTTPRVPKVSKFASSELLEHLSFAELDTDPCPGCGDRFLLPSSYFQHIYRKSVEIRFKCTFCNQPMRFTNKCLLRIHLLSHIQSSTERVSIPVQDLEIVSLTQSEPKNKFEDLFLLHRKSMKELTPASLFQCLECLNTYSEEELINHLLNPGGQLQSSLHCDICGKYSPSNCSFSAHRRIHEKKPPFICPECCQEYSTWSIFRNHISRSCFHDTKTLVYTCLMCCSSSSSGQQRSAHAHSVSTSAGNAQNTNGHSTMFVSTSAAILISHVVNAHIKQFYKCAECPRAFQSKDKFVHHAKTQHAGPGTFKILYKSSAKSSMFFSDVRKLISHLEEEMNFHVVFQYRCNGCQEILETKDSFRTHTTGCTHNFTLDNLYNDKPVEDKYVEVLNDLRRVREDINCKGCWKHGRNFKNHIDKHHTVPLVSPPTTAPRTEVTPEQARQTRNTKRASETEKTDNKKRKSDTSPLKMKIKIVPEPDITPLPASTSSTATPSLKGKTKINVLESVKSSSQFSTLGIDVPSDKELLALNSLKNQDAFIHGSTVLQVKEKNVCQVCLARFNTRDQFQVHIRVHYKLESFQCKECGASFATDPSWRKHLLLIHRIKKPEPDMYCEDLQIQGVGAFSYQDDYESEALEFNLDDHTTGVDHEDADDHEDELDVEHDDEEDAGNDSDSECDRLVIDTGDDTVKNI